MKKQGRFLAFLLVCVMILMQVPFAAFAADTTTDINADLLSPDTLPDGRVEVDYHKQFYYDYTQFDNGYKWYSWSVLDSELPPGLELVSQHSTWQPVIKGTPTKAGTYTFKIKGGRTDYINGENVPVVAAIKTYTMTILPAYPLEIGNSVLYHGNENRPYSVTFEENRNRTVTWSMELADGGTLPDGLSIDDETGKINWEAPIAGKYNLKVTAARGEESVSKVLKLIIEPAGGCKHTDKKCTERKDATCKENGLADYWYCDDCEYYFLDEQCKKQTSADMLDKLYTTAFHSDKNDDGKCDTCQKAMPIFKKVTNTDEITSCGMYLVVSKMGDKYYTLKTPETDYMDSIEAIEIGKNSDGTFSYPKNNDAMILKTDFAAMCADLDAGKPRYSFGTTINELPYSLSSYDSSGSVQLYFNEKNKYGYRMSLIEDDNVAIASVYAEYWGSSESKKGGETDILTAFDAKKDGVPKKFFSFRTQTSYQNRGVYTGNGYEFYDKNSLSTYPIELYKLTYSGTVNDNSYTLSDAQSIVTINNEFTALDNVGSKNLSTAGGISEAVKVSYVESVISAQTDITGDISARTYADISVKNEECTTEEWGSIINSIVYTITPKIEIKDNNSEKSVAYDIDDKYFDGSEMTLSLCVGNMNPEQIIHHKTDGTKEYFYSEYSKSLKPGQKTFSSDEWGTGNFVTFSVESFSDIEILATAKSENEVSYKDGTIKITVKNAGSYALILANYINGRMADVKMLPQALKKGENSVTDIGGFTLTNQSKIFLWKNGEEMEPVCKACKVGN